MTAEQQRQHCNVAKKIAEEVITKVNNTAKAEKLDANVLFWYFSTFVDEVADEVFEDAKAKWLE